MRQFILLLILVTLVNAFVGPQSAVRIRPSPTTVWLSDVPQDESDEEETAGTKVEPSKGLSLPEDILTLSGDLFCLSIYGFTDHFLTHDVASFMVKNSHYHPITLPVWVESNNLFAAHQVYHSKLADRLVVEYSWMFQDTGLAVVLLCSAWLVAGVLNEAFCFKNSLNCKTEINLLTTLTTWMTSTGILLVLLGLFSSSPTNGDIAFILDSLTVLTLWRFLVSSVFGTTK